jgi:hypothetical protein
VSSGTHDPDQWSGMPAPQLQDALSLAYPKEDAAVAGSMQKLGQRRYTTSKLCNILLTAVPAERGIGSIDSEKRDSALRYPPAWQVDPVLGA